MIKVHILQCGSTLVDEALPFSDNSKNKLAYTGLLRGKRHRIEVPVRAYLIEHPTGFVLVDTGWDSQIREHPAKYEGIANHFASPGFLPPGETVDEQLHALGIMPEEISIVILTHLDIDHVGGIRLVKDAKKIMASQAEIAASSRPNPRYVKRLWKDIPIVPFSNEEVDLLGDGSIVLLPLHGHSKGMTGVKVSGAESYLLIAGDAGYGRRSWEKMSLPGVIDDKEEEEKSLKKIRKMALDSRCVDVLFTHDLESKPSEYEL